jgi:hypothetical protein
VGITRDSSLREVAFVVCTALDRAGVTAVLTGGSAATLYAPKAIQSYDLDFVLAVYSEVYSAVHSERGAPASALEELGFRRQGHDYRHPSSRFQLEFPPGPLAIGDERIERWDTLRERKQLLHVLTATDSCRDRLAAFYHFRDRSALDQACSVFAAARRRVNRKKIEDWSRREGKQDEYAEFARRVRRTK